MVWVVGRAVRTLPVCVRAKRCGAGRDLPMLSAPAYSPSGGADFLPIRDGSDGCRSAPRTGRESFGADLDGVCGFQAWRAIQPVIWCRSSKTASACAASSLEAWR